MGLKYAVILGLLVVAELVYFRIAEHFGIVDHPNGRSSHRKVVLRGGGVIYIVGMWLYAAFFGMELWPFLAGLTLAGLVSFVDDVRSLSDGVRLVVQFVAMGLVFYGWGVLQLGYWWMVVPGMVLCVGIVNAYNFMDGINGINGAYTLAVLGALLIAATGASTGSATDLATGFGPSTGSGTVLATGFGASTSSATGLGSATVPVIVVGMLADLVFCVFNFAPKGKARCFAGDVGSVGAAFIVVFLLGRLILATGDFTYLVFLAVYGVDSVLTIVHRIMLRENLGVAHRKHAYQLMANELGMEHTVVAAIYAGLQFVICVVMMVIPKTAAWHWGYFGCVCGALGVAYIVFMKKFYHLHREYLEERDFSTALEMTEKEK